MDQSKKILVTGASGLVGEALIEQLSRDEKYKIIALGGPDATKEFTRRADVEEFRRVDITNVEALNSSLGAINQRIDVIVHCAGLAHQFGDVGREDFERVNVVGTENLCRIAIDHGVRHFVLISSVSVYGGESDEPVDETRRCTPRGFYAESKWRAEEIALQICRADRIDLTVLRLATVIGENDRGNVKRLITQIDDRKFIWIGDGSNSKSLIYKGDVAEAIEKVLAAAESGQHVYNLSDEPKTLKQIVNLIERTTGRYAPKIKIPAALVRAALALNQKTLGWRKIERIGETVKKWLANDIYSAEKFNRRFQYKPSIGVERGIEREVQDF